MGPVPQPDEERDHPNHNNGNDIEDAEHPDVVINADMSDSDSEDEDDVYGGYIGYQALAQDSSAVNQASDSDDSQAEEAEQNVSSQNTSDSCHGDVQCSVPEGLVHQVRHPDFPNTSNLPGYMQVPDLPKPERKDMLWNQRRQTDIPLETDHADKILSVMSNIQLPSSHIPDWARNLSEDQWQVQVVNTLVKQKTSPKNNSDVNKGTSQTARESDLTRQTTDRAEKSCPSGVSEARQAVNEDKLVNQ